MADELTHIGLARYLAERKKELVRLVEEKGWKLEGKTNMVSTSDYLVFLEKLLALPIVPEMNGVGIVAARRFAVRTGEVWIDCSASPEEIITYLKS